MSKAGRPRGGSKLPTHVLRGLNSLGWNDCQIARKFGIRSTSVSLRRRRLGLKPGYKRDFGLKLREWEAEKCRSR